MNRTAPNGSWANRKLGRRNFLGTALASCVITPIAPLALQLGAPGRGSLSKEQRDRMTPAQVIEELRKGNERFRTGKMAPHDYLAQKRSSAAGQYPAAVILGFGDMFNVRIAGNVVNDDLLGSMEFACAAAGAKLVLLLGHTACGAVKGAIDDVVLGNLTGLLARIKPALSATKFDGEKSSKNPAYVDAVARTNVGLGLENIRGRSPILADLEKKGSIQIAGAMYDITTGMVEFLA
jgi:carbonic anhydrase